MTFDEWLVELTRFAARELIRPLLNIILRFIESCERDVPYFA